MRKAIYDKRDGKILSNVSTLIDIHIYCKELPQEFRDNISEFPLPDDLDNIKYYIVKDNKLTKKTEQQIYEIKVYGRVLTEVERSDILLRPSKEEIQKANTTIEILSLLQEVNAI